MLTHLSLFTGIGGIDLAAEWAGFKTVGQCEWADYPTKVLEKHWPNVPRWRDIRDVTAESFYSKTGLQTVDLISGGFPCQPFSVAGKQEGKEDDRYLWPEMLRVITDLSPTWVLGENVPGILSIAADDVCKDLERQGYEVVIFNFEAAAVGAKHRRERVFFVGWNSKHSYNSKIKEISSRENADTRRIRQNVPNSNILRREIPAERKFTAEQMLGGNGETRGIGNETVFNSNQVGCGGNFGGQYEKQLKDGCWWAIEPELGRVANGIPNRVDRIKCLGNAVVPQQVYPILKAIADIEAVGRKDIYGVL